METPNFTTTIADGQVLVTAEQHTLAPDVLFAMLGGTCLRTYNIDHPKEENIFLEEVNDQPEARKAVSELDVHETVARLVGTIACFQSMYNHLGDISERQLEALIDLGRQRLESLE